MSRFLLLFAGLCTALFSLGQDYTMTVEAHATGGIPGTTTYRFYIDMNDETDFLSSIFGNNEAPLELTTPSGFHNEAFASGSTADGVNPAFFGFVPTLQYDSWVTIGIEGSPVPPATAISSVESSAQPWLGSFNAISPLAGQDILINDVTGGAWYVLNGTPNGLPNPTTLRTLFMQITCAGEPSGTINAQVFPLGVGANQVQVSYTFNGPGTYTVGGGGGVTDVLGCTDGAACNFDEAATSDDGSCVFAGAGLDCDGNCLNDSDMDGVCDEFEVVGCSDAQACNYDAEATDEGACTYAETGYDCSGSCLNDADLDGVCDEFEVGGCTDSLACNYNGTATDDDGSCSFAEMGYDCDGVCLNDADGDGICDEFEAGGCTDAAACNYDGAATDDNGTCFYAETGYDCNGSCLADADGDGICDEFEVAGCTDAAACNYDSAASDDNGSCDFCSCAGEGGGSSEPMYTMTVEEHTVDGIPGLTTYRFYIDMLNATDFLSSIFGNNESPMALNTANGFFNDGFASGSTADGVNPAFFGFVPTLAYDSWVTIGIEGSPTPPQTSISSVESSAQPWLGCFNAVSPLSGQNILVNDVTGGAWYVLNGSPNGLPNATTMRTLFMQVTADSAPSGVMNVQVFPQGVGANQVQFSYTFDGLGTYAPDGMSTGGGNACGCTDDTASNYDASADYDDGSCEYAAPGCTDDTACNYDSAATDDNGSCEYAETGYDCSGNCVNDADMDGICDEFEVAGCTDDTACNYDSAATDDNGSCSYAATGYDCGGTCLTDVDADGVCDEFDDCVGPIDGCGVCNGDGTTCTGCADPAASNYDAGNIFADNGQCVYATTFNVDMSCATNAGAMLNGSSEITELFVTGPFIGWPANAGFNQMTDSDGDGIFTVTLDLPAGDVEYKYAVNGFADQENLIDDMANGADCAPITDYSGYANRLVAAGSTTNDTYGSCTACDDQLAPADITFNVDMSTYGNAYGMVNLNGSFNGWCGGCTVMTDDDGDGVYSVTVTLNPGTYEYKFTLDGWNVQEEFTPGLSCTSTIDGFTNRSIEVTETAVLPAVCWNSCEACPEGIVGCMDADANNYNADATFDEGCTYDVTLYVDISQTDFTSVTWAGTANGWNNLSNPMTDSDGDGVYSVELSLPGGANEYKFLGNGDWAVAEMFDGTESCTTDPGEFVNRVIQVDGPYVGAVVCYNSCEACPTSVAGCMDDMACNYDAEATEDDGSCTYAETGYDCSGNCVNDADMDGICDEFEVAGCTDAAACNYDNAATDDNGSCAYAETGYDCAGNCVNDADMDGICDEFEVAGCTDAAACNYDSAASDDNGSCEYAETGYDCAGNCLADADGDGICDEFEVAGCTDAAACNYDSAASDDNGSCDFCSCAGEGGGSSEPMYTMTVEEHAVDGIPGLTTYRFYIDMLNATDFLSSIFGNNESPMALNTANGFFNDGFASGSTADGVNPAFFGFVPTLAYDSWVTIGIEGSPTPPQTSISSVESSAQPWLGCFNAVSPLSGQNILVNDVTGGAWYVLNGSPNGLPNATTMRTLFMQVTADSAPSGVMNVQVFPQGVGANQVQFSYTFDGLGTYAPDGMSTGGGNACGCTDDTASNYDASADYDDGSCEYAAPGCTDDTACNYDSAATDDNGSCEYAETGYDCSGNCVNDADMDGICDEFEVAGCTDDTACNYDSAATDDNGSCEFAETGYDCSGNCVNDADMDGICDEFEVAGCTDDTACNYDSAATDDNGSCEYAETGYDCSGNCVNDADMDGICDEFEVAGCTDDTACNYDSAATDDNGSCSYAETGYDCGGNCLNDSDMDGICDEFEMAGCTDDTACNYDSAATDDNGSCEYAETGYDCAGNCVNDADMDGICDEFEVAGCTDDTACNYDSAATDDNGSCEYAETGYDCSGNCVNDADMDGICDEFEVAGCTDDTACNYDSAATDDNGSCEYAETGYDCSGNCVNDADMDGICDEFEVAGCTDDTACNYDSAATDDNGSCSYAATGYDCGGTCLTDVDSDGVCDEFDDCVGPIDGCGVCNGDGTTCTGCADPAASNYDAGNIFADNGQCVYATTFNVDMSCATNAGAMLNGSSEITELFVTGPFIGWPANAGFNQMTDSDGDGIFTVTLDLPAGDVEYKYAVNGFADQENLIDDMANGADCAPITDYSGYANRLVAAGSTTNDTYGSCTACDDQLAPADITFNVDMSTYGNAYGMVNLNGSFNGWCGGCTVMTDDDGDGVYSVTVTLNPGTYEYKFTLDGWNVQEEFTPGLSCTSTIDGFTNRSIEVTETAVLPAVCWNSCEACPEGIVGCMDADANNYNADATFDEGCTYDVTLYVDISQTDFTSVTWAGTANGWNNLSNPMTDSDGDGVYSVELSLPGGANEYKFLGNGDWAVAEMFDGTESCTTDPGEFVNRVIQVDGPYVGAVVCYNSCEACPTSVAGCMDDMACNYDAEATEDDGSCTYAETGYDCAGNCVNDADMDGICDEFEVAGCTDAAACNYDNAATDDNGSCAYAETGYDCAGNCVNDADMDGICDEFEVAGCTDAAACNYDSAASDDNGSCEYAETGYDCDGSCLADADGDGVCDEFEVPGCTDTTNPAYNANATDDDGSCLVGGCLISFACNYNPDADYLIASTCEFSSCVGCMDEAACNYDPAALIPASCTFPVQYYDCDGNCLSDADGDGVCDELEIFGCTDPNNPGYSTVATEDDGSCLVGGCTQETACNYDADADYLILADCDFVSCQGCTDAEACNYDAAATQDNNSCTYPQLPYLNCDGECNFDADGDGICDEVEVSGCTDPNSIAFYPLATDDDGSCLYPGCTIQGACNYDPTANINDYSCDFTSCIGCGNEAACNYDPAVTISIPPFCNYAEEGYDCDGNCLEDADGDGVCDGDEVLGCTDATACNYNEDATDFDPTSCTYDCYGCMSPSACNFDPTATLSDGSCDFESCVGCMNPNACNYDEDATQNNVGLCIMPPPGGVYGCDGECINDADGDGVCDQNEISGCTDPSATNYNPFATDDNGNCQTLVGGCVLPFACNYDPNADYLIFATCDLNFPCSSGAAPQGPATAAMNPICNTPGACNYLEEGDCVFTAECVLAVTGCMDPSACDYSGEFIFPGLCDYASCQGCTNDTACNYDETATINNGTCEFNSCAGCTDATASNYDDTATIDNGTCQFPGCVIPSACNYDATANISDGSCEYTTCAGCMNALACNYEEGAYTLSDPSACVFAESGLDCDGNCLNDADADGICDEDEVAGCTALNALNYDAAATDDDGSCIFAVPGCTLPTACNYDAAANQNDGSCEFSSCVGCMDAEACTYDADAIYNDALLCTYPAPFYDCDGNCLNDADGDGVCSENDNCEDVNACNFDAADNSECLYFDACMVCGGDGVDTDGDGTCDALEVDGCTDFYACNYNIDATEEDGTCEYCSCSETFASEDGYTVYTEVVAEHTTGELAGMTTYRLYLASTSAGDVVTSFTGNNEFALELNTTTSFYQHPGGTYSAAGQTNFLLSNFPEAAYDSYITMNLTAPEVAANGESNISVAPGAAWVSDFEAGSGFLVNDIVGSGWYVTPDVANAQMDENNRMLFAQLTTSGDLSGSFRAQVFPGGDASQDLRIDVTFGDADCGCTDPLACNYDDSAIDDNGSCEFTSCAGCMDETACNYEEGAYTVSDDTDCEYAEAGYNCDGTCLVDVDADGICDEFEILGCLDETACNYNADATDAGDCLYPILEYIDCLGACLNDADGDGICDELEVAGCTNANACNYNAAATDEDGSCTSPASWYVDCDGNCLYDFDGDGICNQDESLGCTDAMACNYVATATEEDGTCTYPAETYLDCAGECLNDADGDGICDELEVGGCTDDMACNYDMEATDEDGSCVYAEAGYDCDGICLNDADLDGVCDEFEIAGCQDQEACNFNTESTDSDPAQCTYPLADYLDCDGQCLNDSDGDGVCDEDEIVGCQEADACNYLPTATEAADCDYCSCQGNEFSIAGYSLYLDPVAEHTDGELAGMTTYHVYLNTPNADDVLTAVIGDDEFPFEFSTTTTFYQHPGAGFSSAALTSFLLNADPLAQYDSYFTVGLTQQAVAANGEEDIAAAPGTWVSEFEAGNSFLVNDAIGSGYYVVPTAVNALVGDDHRILIAQLTTDGKIDGSFRAQIFPNGDQISDDRVDVTFVNGICACTDDIAVNYDPMADFDDGSCIYEFPGCTDELACNYQPLANIEDGSCTYAEAPFDCDGNCLNDLDGDGICDEFEIAGCTDALSCNFDATATDDNGSCEYESCAGCMDATACNYVEGAYTISDANDCEYPAEDYIDCAGDCLNDADQDGVCDELELAGCQDMAACNFNAAATDEDNTQCTYPAEEYLDCAGNCLNDVDQDGVCDELEVAGCQDDLACNYNADATDSDGSCTYPTQDYLDCAGNCLNDADGDGICDEIEVGGCTDAGACNYDEAATDDDGSCEYATCAGCLDETACNYVAGIFTISNPEACEYPAEDYLDCAGECLNDADEDGVCDELEVPGCIDALACNYSDVATDDDGSCTYPAEAYLDCEGNCLGDADGDGVCNELEVVGCQDEAACDYNADATDAGACDYESCAGCTYATADNYDADATIENGSCIWAGCTYEGYSNYDPTATVDDGSCTDAPNNADFNGDGIVQNQDLLDFLLAYGQTGPEWGGLEWIQGACNVEPIPLDELITAVDYCSAPDAPENCEALGCTYPSAANYDAAATVDSGDCVWTGCTDSDAVNYDSNASIDDGTCTYNICPDFNGDGQVQAQDLLNFLLAWGTMY